MSHKNIILLILFIFLVNCSTQKVTRIHGNLSLKNNENFILVNKSNKNDIRDLIGPPSSISDFGDIWFYIERKKTKILDLGTGEGHPGVLLSIIGYKNIFFS